MELSMNCGRFFQNKKIPFWYNSNILSYSEIESRKGFRLIMIEEGAGISKINSLKTILISPTIICLSENDNICLDESKNIVAKVLYFHPSLINTALTIENIRDTPNSLSLTDKQDICLFKPFVERNNSFWGQLNINPMLSQRISNIFNSIDNVVNTQGDKFWPCHIRSYLLELLLIIERIYLSPDSKNEILLPLTKDEIHSILLYIHTNYENKITVENLCSIFHINRTTLQEKFKSTTGLSIINYLIKLRIKLSSTMLRDTKLPISEIMLRSGFNDSTHFGKMFRKHTGHSPKEYRTLFSRML